MSTAEFESIITADGHRRILNLLPSDEGKVRMYSRPVADVIPQSELRPFDDFPAAVQVKDQDGAGACFPAGTRVRMEDGSERNIDDVRLLDRVLTAEGNVGRVVRTMVRDADDGLVRLSLWGHNHLKATAEHPILTRRGYVPLGELTLGDWVCLPKHAPCSKRTVHVADHLPARVMTTRAGKGRRHFNAPEGRRQVDVSLAAVPDVIELSRAVGRIFGFFLAEGRSDSNKVTFTFNKTEEATHVAELVNWLKLAWDVTAHLQHRPNNSINVVVYGKAWALLFEALCANGSGGKRIHADLASGPPEFLDGMLTAWLDGDGHARRGSRQGVSVSRELALGMYDVAQALGRRPSIRRYEMKTYGSVASRRPRWEVDIPDAQNDTYRCEDGERCVWRKVKGIEREEFEGPVFNLEVEGDNSYVAEGVGVHNCNGHAAASAVEVARAAQGLAYVPLSAWWVYGRLVNGRDRGSNIMDALVLCQQQGVAPESTVKYGDFSGRYSDEAKSNAARFKIEIGSAVGQDWEAICSEVAKRRVLNAAVRATAGWSSGNLDADGCPPEPVFGPCNHAVLFGGGLKKLANGEWAVRMLNSWGTRWGLKGYCWVRRGHVEKTSFFEAYSIRAISEDPQDAAPPAR